MSIETEREVLEQVGKDHEDRKKRQEYDDYLRALILRYDVDVYGRELTEEETAHCVLNPSRVYSTPYLATRKVKK